MNRIILLSLFLCTHSLYAQNDSTNGSWSMLLRGDLGFIIAHRPALEPLQEGHVKGFEFSIQKHTSGKLDWENIFYYPDYGLTAVAFDLATDKLGKGFAAYPYIDFPLRKNHGSLHFRFGMGLGYIQKHFDPVENIKNAGIGTHLNGVIHFDIHGLKYISKKTALELGAGITHYSNGSFALPNLGINIATVNLAISRSFGKNVPIVKKEIPPSVKSVQYHVYAGGFLKKVYPPLGRNFFAATLSAMRYKPINTKSAWGIGVDVFYDNSLSFRLEKDSILSHPTDNFRPGVYGAYHLSVNRLGLMFNMGYYLYTKFKDDGNVYHRICLRYYFEKLFLCVNLKTHYARADFIEVGGGITIK